MQVLRVIVFFGLIISFLFALFTKIFIVFAIFGPMGLFVMKQFFKKPDAFTTFQFGIEISLAAYIIYFAINLFVFGKIYTCPGIIVSGFILFPFISGCLTLVANQIPTGENELNKVEFITLSRFKL